MTTRQPTSADHPRDETEAQHAPHCPDHDHTEAACTTEPETVAGITIWRSTAVDPAGRTVRDEIVISARHVVLAAASLGVLIDRLQHLHRALLAR